MSTNVVTGRCRASFVNVFSPRLNEMNGKEEYSMLLLVPKADKDTVTKMQAAIKAAQAKKWGAKVPAAARNPLRDGDTDASYENMAETDGHYVVNVKAFADQKPGVIDKTGQDIIDPTKFMSGDYCRAELNAFAYDSKGNKGVSFGLNNILVLEKGEPLGGKRRAADAFSAFLTPEDEAFLG